MRPVHLHVTLPVGGHLGTRILLVESSLPTVGAYLWKLLAVGYNFSVGFIAQRSIYSAPGVMLGPGDLKIFKMQSLPLRAGGGPEGREGGTDGDRNIMNCNYRANNIKHI